MEHVIVIHKINKIQFRLRFIKGDVLIREEIGCKFWAQNWVKKCGNWKGQKRVRPWVKIEHYMQTSNGIQIKIPVPVDWFWNQKE